MIARFFRGVGIAALALPLTACAKPAPAPTATAKPALWMVKDKDTTIYLFGSMHVLPDTLKWRTPAIERAIAQSQGLVLETVLDRDPTKAGQTMLAMGMDEGPQPPLLDRVPADKRATVAAAVERSQVPMMLLDRLESWASALVVSATLINQTALKRDAGVEAVLTQTFEKAGKPVTGLETPREQLSFFDDLPEPSQRAFLATIDGDPAKMNAEIDKMVRAWSTGDGNAIVAAFDTELRDNPDLRAQLLTRRNANWTRWIAQRMAQPGTIMVAVGAGHLAGPDSVVAMLEQQGIKVRRVTK